MRKGSSVLAKLIVVIVAVGCCACGLLVARHLRTQAAHELAAARLRIIDQDARLARLRAEIAERVSPDKIVELADELSLQPAPPPGSPSPPPPPPPPRPPATLADGNGAR